MYFGWSYMSTRAEIELHRCHSSCKLTHWFPTIGATLAEVQQGMVSSPEEQRALAGFCQLKAIASQRAECCSE